MYSYKNLKHADRERAATVHQNSIIIDTHCDTIIHLTPRTPVSVYFSFYFDISRDYTAADIGTDITYPGNKGLGEKSDNLSVDIPKMYEGGQTCQVFSLWMEPEYKPERCVKRTLQMVDTFQTMLEANPNKISFATTVDDIIKAKDEERVVAMLSVESGGDAIEGDLSVLRVLYRLGLRMFGLTYNRRNMLADGNAENKTKSGLTDLGVQVVEECNRLGIIVDISHISDTGFYDVLDVTKAPIIASHHGPRALHDIPRFMTDDQIKALAENSGVMGVMYGLGPKTEVTLGDVVDRIDHVVKVAGVEYVGLGSDWDGGCRPTGLEDSSKLPNMTRELVARGYSDEEIRKILGGNFMRVFNKVL
ncbi:MAG: dipeptidase [Desulfobacteraceae bacterium]|nr:dipeptidase [Desulfobacteraceae bacterium]